MKYNQSSYFNAISAMVERINASFPNLKEPVKAYICGGSAIMFWVKDSRISLDVDMFFSKRIIPPQDLAFTYFDNDGLPVDLDFDYNFNENFSLLQADFHSRSQLLYSLSNLKVHVIAPVDLSIMKLSRFSGQDREDIKALIENDLLNDVALFRYLAEDAMKDYIGNLHQIEISIQLVERWIKEKQMNLTKNSLLRHRP